MTRYKQFIDGGRYLEMHYTPPTHTSVISIGRYLCCDCSVFYTVTVSEYAVSFHAVKIAAHHHRRSTFSFHSCRLPERKIHGLDVINVIPHLP